MTHLPIRVRLAGWYAAAFTCALAAASLDAYWTVHKSLNGAIDEGLRSRVEGTRRFIEEQLPHLSLDQITAEFQDHLVVAMGPSAGPIQVSDATGAFIYQAPAFRDAALPPARPAALGTEPTFEDRTIHGEPVRILTARIDAQGRRFGVQVATVTTDNAQALADLRTRGLTFGPLLLIVASLGGYWISSRALKPVATITDTARAINTRSLNQRLDVPLARDELWDLSETLNMMLDRLEAAFQQVSRFTADASHELRTPVAMIRTSAEVVLRKARTAEEYRQSLVEIRAEAERMSALVEDLLTLARADRDAEPLRLHPIDLVSLLQEMADSAAHLSRSRQLRFVARLPDHAVVVDGDPAGLRRLVLILTDNAVKYTPAPGDVEWSLTMPDGTAVFEITDTGIGIESSDLPHVFERFYRADKARSRDSGGAGLGLAIAKWIVDRHGGAIAVTSSGRGCQLRVTIPTSAPQAESSPTE
jgi:two-component system, OmpR family, heavy metal sensor histidine kinase CusS